MISRSGAATRRLFGASHAPVDDASGRGRIVSMPGQLVGQATDAVGVGEPGDPLGRGGEQDAVAVVGGRDAQPGGQMGLTGPGRAEQDDVAGFGEEPARGQ